MARLTKDQVKQAIDNRPAGTSPSEVVNALVSRGHQLEGYSGGSQQPAGQARPTGYVAENIQAVKNVPSSAGRLVSDFAKAVTSPIQTAKAIGQVGLGLAQKGAEGLGLREDGNTQSEQAAQVLLDFYKDRYGGKEQIKQTAINDPVGLIADLTGLLGGVGAAAKAAGTVGKVGGLAQAGRAVESIANTLDPIAVSTKVATNVATKAVPQRAGSFGAYIAGITSGTEDAPILAFERTLRGDDMSNVKAAMRGGTADATLRDRVLTGIDSLERKRAAEYRDALGPEVLGKKLEASKVFSKLDEALDAMDLDLDLESNDLIKVRPGAAVGFPPEQLASVRRAVISTLNELSGGKVSVETLDRMKRGYAKLYQPGEQIGVFSQRMKSALRDVLNEGVPGYKQRSADYEKASTFIDEMKSVFSAKDSANPETVVNKLQGIFSRNKQYRRELLDEFGRQLGVDLSGEVAGGRMSPAIANAALARIIATLSLGTAFINPAAAVVSAPFFSPRLVGEAAIAGGRAARAAGKVGDATSKLTGSAAVNELLRTLTASQNR